MIDNIEIYLCYENLNIYEVFTKLKNSGLYSELEFINHILSKRDISSDNYILNKKTIDCIDSIKTLDVQDKNNIKGFLSMLGKSDLNGQILNCRTYKEFFKRKLDDVEQSEKSKCKSTYTLISGLGIISIIVVI